MDKNKRIAWRIERLENDIEDTKRELARTLHAVAKNFEYTANQIENKSEEIWFNDAEYVEHNTVWIKEYCKRIASYENDLKIMKDFQGIILDD